MIFTRSDLSWTDGLTALDGPGGDALVFPAPLGTLDSPSSQHPGASVPGPGAGGLAAVLQLPFERVPHLIPLSVWLPAQEEADSERRWTHGGYHHFLS